MAHLQSVIAMSSIVHVELSLSCPRAGVPSKASFSQWAQAAFDAAKAKGFAADIGVSIKLVDDQQAREINAHYRHKDYATNVLSFPAERPPGMPKSYKADWLGDLVIASAVIAKEAAEQGKTVRAHFAHMCVHGVLHLLGFDHLVSAEAKRMEALEVKILAQLGFANPY
jgi:probable rRNA maturation factor